MQFGVSAIRTGLAWLVIILHCWLIFRWHAFLLGPNWSHVGCVATLLLIVHWCCEGSFVVQNTILIASKIWPVAPQHGSPGHEFLLESNSFIWEYKYSTDHIVLQLNQMQMITLGVKTVGLVDLAERNLAFFPSGLSPSHFLNDGFYFAFIVFHK